MDDAYDAALSQVAITYEEQYAVHGGRSLSRVATIVVSSGAFFQRLFAGKTITTANLDKMAAFFRDPANWPARTIPVDASRALASIGRPPFQDPAPASTPAGVAPGAPIAPCDRGAVSQRGAA